MTESPARIGARLKAAREQKGWSVHKAADELRLDDWVVEALEADDYARVGPSVYVKGHLKRYSGLLGLNAADLLSVYEARLALPPPPTPPAAQARRELPPVARLSWPPLAALAVLLLLAVVVVLLRPHRAPSQVPISALSAARHGAESSAGTLISAPDASTLQPNAPARAPLPALPQPLMPAAAVNLPAKVPASAIGTAAAILRPAPLSAAAATSATRTAAAGAGRARLRLSFSADSWVDVHDALGQRVYAGNGRANSVRVLSGAAPMHVYLKFASGVQLEINDHAVAIGRQFMAGDVARFEAGADGVLRRAPPVSVAQARNSHPAG